MKAYKATNKNMQCLDFQFELNKEFIHNDELVPCRSGFHFCKELKHVFNYYDFTPVNRFFEVEIPDDALVIDYDDKSVTNKIKFIRELSLADIKELTNGEYYVDTDGGWIISSIKYFFNENGLLHREDGPAVIGADGDQAWWQNGKLHRDDGPAKIWAGDQYWFRDGECHREDGPATIYANGSQQWVQNGKLHRDNNPAIIFPDGRQAWYQNGKLHREDGPALIYTSGHQEWWKNGVFIK